MRNVFVVSLMIVMTLAIASCSRNDPAPRPEPDKGFSSVDKAKYLLATEPNDAKGIKAVRKEAKDGDEIVMIGRIGGSAKPFTGRAAFTIVDTSFVPCNEKGDDNCATPWDYCCDAPDELAKGTILVKFVDEAGKTLAKDAKAFLGIKELQTVVIQGHIRRDGDNVLSVVASGLFIKK